MQILSPGSLLENKIELNNEMKMKFNEIEFHLYILLSTQSNMYKWNYVKTDHINLFDINRTITKLLFFLLYKKKEKLKYKEWNFF